MYRGTARLLFILFFFSLLSTYKNNPILWIINNVEPDLNSIRAHQYSLPVR